MPSGFGSNAGPGVQQSEHNPFRKSPCFLSPQPPTSYCVDFSVRRSPLPVATPHLTPGSSQPFAASSRDFSLRWDPIQSSMNGGFIDRSLRNLFPNYTGTSNSAKVLPSMDSESSRRPPIEYNDDFLNEPINGPSEGHADVTSNHNVASQRRQSPISVVASNQSIVNASSVE